MVLLVGNVMLDRKKIVAIFEILEQPYKYCFVNNFFCVSNKGGDLGYIQKALDYAVTNIAHPRCETLLTCAKHYFTSKICCRNVRNFNIFKLLEQPYKYCFVNNFFCVSDTKGVDGLVGSCSYWGNYPSEVR